MSSLLPIIRMTDLQRHPKEVLAKVEDYAVIQSHGHDRAFVLHPRLGKVLLESGMLEVLRTKAGPATTAGSKEDVEGELKSLIGNVLRELSKK